MSNSPSSGNTQSVEKALAILSTFSDACPHQRVTDIAEKLQLNISTVSRHLSTMLDCGFLVRDDLTGYYSLGVKIVTLAGIALHSQDVYRHAYPELLHLSQKTGLHCYLGIASGTEVIHLISIGGEETVELLTPIGYHHPMYCSAMGRAIMSQMPQDKVNSILDSDISMKYAPDTKTDRAEILKELALVKKQGYAVIINELTIGKASISSPVFNRNREPIAAISISGNIFTLNLKENEEFLSKQVRHSANKISGKMGFFPK